MTDTPETDAIDGHAGCSVDLPILCRKLERERDDYKEKYLLLSAQHVREIEAVELRAEEYMKLLLDARGLLNSTNPTERNCIKAIDAAIAGKAQNTQV